MEFWESMEDFVNRDGPVDRERYEEARGLREEVSKILGGSEREIFEKKTKWAERSGKEGT